MGVTFWCGGQRLLPLLLGHHLHLMLGIHFQHPMLRAIPAKPEMLPARGCGGGGRFASCKEIHNAIPQIPQGLAAGWIRTGIDHRLTPHAKTGDLAGCNFSCLGLPSTHGVLLVGCTQHAKVSTPAKNCTSCQPKRYRRRRRPQSQAICDGLHTLSAKDAVALGGNS